MPASPEPSDPLFGNSLSGLLGAAMETVQPDSQAVPDKWEPPSPEHIAVLLPQYRIEHLIGRGGMGAVYKGRQITLNRPVAIKILPAELARNREFVARFHREAQLLASLSHQGIVTIFDFGQTTEGHLYFVMEFVDGTDLHRLIHKTKLDAEQALKLTIQICEALQYAHDMGVIHRDIKPANVLVTRDGRAKLADFGLALKPAEHGLDVPEPPQPADFDPHDPMGIAALRITKPGTAMGTPDYAAPEVYDGKADSRSDIYALGIMLYEMLTGAPPKGYYQLPSSKAKVDVRIDRVVVKALDPDPSARYQKASDMRLAVENATKPLPAKAPVPPKGAQAPAKADKARAQRAATAVPPPSAAPSKKSFLRQFAFASVILLTASAAYDSQHSWAWTRLVGHVIGIGPTRKMVQRIEGESLKVISVTGGRVGPASVERVRSAVWSGGTHLLWRNSGRGNVLKLQLPVDEGGRQRIKAVFSQSNDMAVVEVALDGVPVPGSPFDFEAEALTVSDVLDFGERDLLAGDHELTLTLVDTHGRDTSGNGAFGVGLDYIRLEPPVLKWTPAAAGTDVAPLARPSASESWGTDKVQNINSGSEPSNLRSGDRTIPHLSWYPDRGSVEWAQYEWETPQCINECRFFWYDDLAAAGGECTVPTFWRLLYREPGGAWVPVDAVIPEAEKDKWSIVKFPAVKTTALRVIAQCKEDWSSGICVWKAIAADPAEAHDDQSRSLADLFLGDLPPLHARVSWSRYHVGYVEKDARKNGSAIKPGGKATDRFLWVHADTRLQFAIPQGYTRFSAIGVATVPAVSNEGQWKYIVEADGKKLFESKELSSYANREVPIDITFPVGSKHLTILTDSCGDSYHDNAYLAFPTLSASNSSASSESITPTLTSTAPSTATPSPVNREGDPLIGKWWWSGEMQSTFAPDGTFARSDGGTGTWEEKTPAGVSARSYLIKWRDASTTQFTLKPGYVELDARSSGKPDALLCKIPLQPSPPTDESPQPLEPGYVSLFDRDHIGGWSHVGAGSFDIVKGSYATSSPAGEYQPWGLFWYSSKTFSDFVLKVDFAVDASYTNSGVYFRLPKLGAGKPNLFFDNAYEAEIRGEETGMLTGATERRRFPLPVGKWNTMEITAIGQSITVTVNGQTMSQLIGTRNLSGYIALQNLGCCGSAYFRNVRIKEIDAEPSKPMVQTQSSTDEVGSHDFVEKRKTAVAWLRAAKTIVSQIADGSSRQTALKDIASAFAKYGDYDEAISIAKSITDRGVQGRAFANIALTQTQQDELERAVVTATMPSDAAAADRSLAGIIGELMTNGDKARAERVATRLTTANGKARYLVELAMEASKKGDRSSYQRFIEEAKQQAVTLKEQADLKNAFRAIVTAEVKAGEAEKAKQTAKLYTGHRFGTPLIDIVEAQAEKGDIKGAHATFNAGGFTMYPACLALARIADGEAEARDYEAARRSAGRLWYSDHKLMAQSSVELKAGNLTLARKAADGLLTCDHLDGNRADVHARTLGRTAALQAEKEDVAATLQWINGLSSPGARIHAYLSLADHQVAQLPPPNPRRFTDTNGSKIEATLLSIKDDEVTLKLRSDGRTYTLPMKRFSPGDIEFFKSLTQVK